MSKQRLSTENYITINIDGKPIAEHRYVMEQHLGRKLTEDEVVHHLNRNKQDNRIENLVLCKNDAEHRKLYHSGEKYNRPKTKKMLSVTIDENTLNELKAVCQSNSLNMSLLVQNLIEKFLNERSR